ncbi:MAG: CPBP family intramembrane metalloprotease [Oscillospiraceae bacterium]|nr:CPBP family intramembrane metalloprotease [Oscillospiraceae bacterium]
MKKIQLSPVVKAVLLAFVPILFASVAGAVISIQSFEEPASIWVQAAAFAVSSGIGLLFVRKSRHNFSETGFKRPESGWLARLLYLLPLVVVEALPFATGFNGANDAARVVALLVFTCVVGFHEELYFRGLILRVLEKIGVKKAVVLSAALFGLGHAATALSGADPLYVVLQIAFAALFGVVAAETVFVTGSLIPVMVWHTAHDFIAFITIDGVEGLGLVLLAIQSVILLGYAIFLWRRLVGGLTARGK